MTNKQEMSNNKFKERGITLVALVITIIVLLILAGVTINGIFDKGIIKNTKNAKENGEILEEKETIQMAILFAKQVSPTGDITSSDIENAMRNVVDQSIAKIVEDTDYIVVRFKNSNRHYTIDNAEEIAGPIELGGIENAGDLTKGGKQKGTEEKPYIINCIEDLVVFSRDYATYESSYVILEKTLDFNSIFSYNDYASKAYGDLNGDGTEDELKTELTKQGDTCGGFTPIASFKGTFDGQNNKICNLYENRGEQEAGLFKYTEATIKNLGLQNITLIGSQNIGGIVVATKLSNIENCYVEGNSTIKFLSGKYIGLIVGHAKNNKSIIKESFSTGNLKIEATEGTFGGILGCADNDPEVYKCFNIMDINTNISTGGIVGHATGVKVEQCFHVGDISGGEFVAGIVGNSGWRSCYIKNCYNNGNITAKKTAAGIQAFGGLNCFNCYSVGEILRVNSSIKDCIMGMNYGAHMVHCFGRRGDAGDLTEEELTIEQITKYLSHYNNYDYGYKENARVGDECGVLADDEMKQQSFVDELNILIEAGYLNDDLGKVTTTTQNVWKIDENNINNGYPIFTWQEQTEENTD